MGDKDVFILWFAHGYLNRYDDAPVNQNLREFLAGLTKQQTAIVYRHCCWSGNPLAPQLPYRLTKDGWSDKLATRNEDSGSPATEFQEMPRPAPRRRGPPPMPFAETSASSGPSALSRGSPSMSVASSGPPPMPAMFGGPPPMPRPFREPSASDSSQPGPSAFRRCPPPMPPSSAPGPSASNAGPPPMSRGPP